MSASLLSTSVQLGANVSSSASKLSQPASRSPRIFFVDLCGFVPYNGSHYQTSYGQHIHVINALVATILYGAYSMHGKLCDQTCREVSPSCTYKLAISPQTIDTTSYFCTTSFPKTPTTLSPCASKTYQSFLHQLRGHSPVSDHIFKAHVWHP
jgi:hypothetical protein